MVATSDTPLLLLDGQLNIVIASNSFCDAFGLDCPAVIGQSFLDVGEGEWNRPQLRSLLSAVIGGTKIVAYEFDLASRGSRTKRRLTLSAHKLDYDDPGVVRVLLSVADGTDAHEAKALTEQLLADKLLLNRELQHRVANSLQIIASVLMQSARRAGSDESRDHLHKAHNRVLSIAAVQKQLAETGEESVKMRPYLTQLCASIGASMIAYPERLSIVVEVDDSVLPSDESVSLGLIVTELVINALKHAYPNDRAGTIHVRYSSEPDSWQLEVADDGVGMPPVDSEQAEPGLGTSIVEALVRQRRARITVRSAHPGTVVSIRHEAARGQDAKIVPMQRAV